MNNVAVWGFLFTFPQRYKKDAFSGFFWKHKRLSLTEMWRYEQYCYWWAVSCKKILIKPRIFPGADNYLLQSFSPPVRREDCFAWFPGFMPSWGKEVIAERISESPSRGCPWNNTISLCNNDDNNNNNRKNRSLPVQVVPDLRSKMLMTNR